MRFHFLRYFFLLPFFLATAASAQPVEKRVLFIVETSKETKALAEAERKVVGALIETGLGGLLEANDTFGIWTFNDTLHVGNFPMQRWMPESRYQLVARSQDFLKSQPYEKTARIETVWRPLQNLIRTSPALMVVLITSGKHPISGTPFDGEINRHLKGAYREYQKRKTPAVIVLSVTAGEVLRYSVNPAIGDVRIPVLTLPPPTVAPVKIAQATPAPQIKTAPSIPKPATPPLAPKADTDAAFVITKDGLKNVSRLEADQISTDNFERSPRPETAIPIGPVILKHEVEVLTHVIQPEPPPVNLVTPAQASPEIVIKSEATLPALPVVSEPIPVVTSVPAPEQVEPLPVIPAQPKVISEPSKAPEPIAPVIEATVVQVAPVEVVQKVEIPPVTAAPQKIEQIAQPSPPSLPPTTIPVSISIDETSEMISTPVETTIPSETQIVTPTTTANQQLVAQTTLPSSRSFPYLAVAIALMLLAIVLAFLVGRQTGKRPQQSLVSDWAERDRAKK